MLATSNFARIIKFHLASDAARQSPSHDAQEQTFSLSSSNCPLYIRILVVCYHMTARAHLKSGEYALHGGTV